MTANSTKVGCVSHCELWAAVADMFPAVAEPILGGPLLDSLDEILRDRTAVEQAQAAHRSAGLAQIDDLDGPASPAVAAVVNSAQSAPSLCDRTLSESELLILKVLAKADRAVYVADIAEDIDRDRRTVVKLLAKLKELGLVGYQGRTDGRSPPDSGRHDLRVSQFPQCR